MRRAPRVYFSTCSTGLARDVAALLLRLGIVARLRVSLGVPGTRPVHTVDVSGAVFLGRFVGMVGGYGPRAAPVAVLAQRLANTKANTNVDTVPIEAFDSVRAHMLARGITMRAMAQMRGTTYGGLSQFRFAPSRALISEYADLLSASDLDRMATSDLFWDRVIDVVPLIEEEDVYDLTVPGPSSWLSDGVVSHNSGAIEQDADMILLIYREEVYDSNTTKKGIAEIDLVKHRNGEIGTFVLTFQGQFTRFANYAPDAYAEGVLQVSRLIRAVIDTGALRHNVRKIRERARGARLMAVVKANAYGHGLVPTALALAEVDAFAVARLEEGLALRAQGVTQPIVLLEGVFAAEQLLEAARARLRPRGARCPADRAAGAGPRPPPVRALGQDRHRHEPPRVSAERVSRRRSSGCAGSSPRPSRSAC